MDNGSEWELPLESRRDEEGLYGRSIRFKVDGTLVLEGHDLGEGVRAIFGFDEYEFVRTLAADAVARLCAALRVADSSALRPALAARFARPGGARAFEEFLVAESIPSSFWNRIGD